VSELPRALRRTFKQLKEIPMLTRFSHTVFAGCALVALLAVQAAAATTAAPMPGDIRAVASDAPAGDYVIDKPHASLLFRVSHMGFSHFTGHFARFDATLKFDPKNPALSRVEATVDPASLESDNPPAGFLEMLRGNDWLDAGQFPGMSFRSTSVTLTGPNSARILGDFTLHGITKPVALDAVFNGGYASNKYDPRARIGFSAHGSLKRSDFGIVAGIPAPGSSFGVGDDVEIILECEFSGPPQ
jgi:polyisoprenoid-binding protein YceI